MWAYSSFGVDLSLMGCLLQIVGCRFRGGASVIHPFGRVDWWPELATSSLRGLKSYGFGRFGCCLEPLWYQCNSGTSTSFGRALSPLVVVVVLIAAGCPEDVHGSSFVVHQMLLCIRWIIPGA